MPDGLDADFATFVSSSYASLVRYGVTLVADRGHAEDLVQASLVKTHAAWGRLTDGSPGAYTKKVMARAAWRAGQRRWRAEVPTSPLPDRLGPSSGFEAVDDADVVLRALARLHSSQRVVLVLRFLDGLTEAETARLLGCRPGTVKSRTARALETLRQLHLLADEPSGRHPAARKVGPHD
jgi:RNA polymerase sigma-70 factor (sigma-E family)